MASVSARRAAPCKLAAPLGGSTVLEHTLAAVRASGLPWHLEDAGHPGMGDSLSAAVRATADAPGWLVLPADLPLVSPQTLLKVADALHAGPEPPSLSIKASVDIPWVSAPHAARCSWR